MLITVPVTVVGVWGKDWACLRPSRTWVLGQVAPAHKCTVVSCGEAQTFKEKSGASTRKQAWVSAAV